MEENNTFENPQPSQEAAQPQQETPKTAPRKASKPQKPESRARKFTRVVFGSMLGFILAQVVMSVLGIIMLVGIIAAAAGSDTPTAIGSNSVLELKLSGEVMERTLTDMPAFANQGVDRLDLNDILRSIESAADDDKIEGISLNVGMLSASPASITAIRNALLEFKKSEKFVYAYGDNYTQGAYYLASVADSLFINPQGTMDIRGLCGQVMFYKGLIDKLNIDVQVVKCGKFKSAVEPYLMDKMSEANREQMQVLFGSIWEEMTSAIAASRNITTEDINRMADSLLIRGAQDAISHNLIDRAVYRSDYNEILRSKAGISGDKKLALVSISDYVGNIKEKSASSSNKIAVIYAYGQINDGKGDESTIGDVTLGKEIRDAGKDKDVKAIVLRVNSPGGSALASEIIWNEIENAKRNGKKVVVSMGDYAASGGYYISCNSDYIFAEPTTLTGSIGVFGIIPSVGRFLDTKLGITTDEVKTNAHSDALTGMRPMDETEYAWLQHSVDQTYDTFLQRVSDGRGISKAQVDSIGQGRVWSGKDAIQIGLVDQLGNLNDAIRKAAQLAGIEDYKISYPAKKSFWDTLLEFADSKQDESVAIREQLGDLYPAYNALKQIRSIEGTQALMPMEVIIK